MMIMKPIFFFKKSILRYLVASLGGIAITVTLFLFMHDGVTRFLLKDPIKYFTITDFILAPDRGRQLPDAPLPVSVAPTSPTVDFDQFNEVIVGEEEVLIEDVEEINPSIRLD